MDELIGPLLKARWFDAIENSKNPLGDLKRALRQFVQEDINSGAWIQGCPLNNLAQEMSPLDEGFRQRLDKPYVEWRKSLAAGLSAGIKAGKVRKDVSHTECRCVDRHCTDGHPGHGQELTKRVADDSRGRRAL